MPNYRTHLVGGVCAYAILLYLIACPPVIIVKKIELLLCALAGSLFPDVDTKSKAQKLFYWLILIVAVALVIKQRPATALFLLMLSLTPLFLPHRGFTHSPIGMTLVILGCMGLAMVLQPACMYTIAQDGSFFIAGFFSHILLDKYWKKPRFSYRPMRR